MRVSSSLLRCFVRVCHRNGQPPNGPGRAVALTTCRSDLYICEQWSKNRTGPNGLHMTALHQCIGRRGWQETASVR